MPTAALRNGPSAMIDHSPACLSYRMKSAAVLLWPWALSCDWQRGAELGRQIQIARLYRAVEGQRHGPVRAGAVGPTVVAEPDCTIWVPAGWVAEPGAAGALVLRRTA